jgi:mannose-1-phosphate guanylyltransferase
MVNILLCGGQGSRLWPISREDYPKQFCKLTGKYSLFQETLLRNGNICEKTIVVTNAKHFSLVKSQINELEITTNVDFILEPVGRNTAPAITIACLAIDENEIAFVTPSDSYIKDGGYYQETVGKAKMFASKEGYMVTFGIKPAGPDTKFGYIEADGEDVVSFHEKPDLHTAQKYFESGNYFWNSGMFAFNAGTFLEQIEKHSKKIFDASKEAFDNRSTDGNVISISKSDMEKIPADSIDYAVMEKSEKIKMLSFATEWLDLGSFEAIHEISKSDINGNASSPENILLNSKNNFIISNNKTVILIDVDDLIVVDTGDAVLISKRGSSQKIKELIPELERVTPGITKTHHVKPVDVKSPLSNHGFSVII